MLDKAGSCGAVGRRTCTGAAQGHVAEQHHHVVLRRLRGRRLRGRRLR